MDAEVVFRSVPLDKVTAMSSDPRVPFCKLAAFLCLLASPALAYNPPVDKAGPLTVRIEAPETVTQTEKPHPVRVVIENQSDAAVRGTVEVGVIDRWRVDPAGPAAFSVGGKGKTTKEFTVTAGEETYSAHYPIHAFARFEADGKALVAHPILVLQTQLPQRLLPARASEDAYAAWKPVRVPAQRELALWRVPVRRMIVQVFGQQPQVMPVGWQGVEPNTRANFGVHAQTLAGQTREAIFVHPPYHEGRVGTALVEFPLQLPECSPLRLRFSSAVTPEGRGDGVTFRVRVAQTDAPSGTQGKVVFERHSAAKTWQPGEADLSAFAGKEVRLQLESHPGPKNDTGWDSSFWAEPVLLAGTPPAPAPFPPKDDAGSRVLGVCGAAVPAADAPGKTTPVAKAGETLAPQCEVRVWPGQRGMLDAVVGFGEQGRRLYFRGFEVRAAGDRLDDPRSPVVLVEAKEEPCSSGLQVRHRFEGAGGKVDLLARLFVEKNVLRAKFWLENTPPASPWRVVYLEDVAAGPWSRKAYQVYAGHGNVVRQPQAFRLGFDGHRLASSFVGFDFEGGPSLVQAVDVPPECFDVRPAEGHYSLHAPHASTFTFIPAQNVFDAVKTWREVNGLRASAGVKKLAGRFVFDLWGGRYKESGEQLRRAFRYGLTDSCVIWHNWQRWGYDYRLPEIYPASPEHGTQEELRAMIELCKRARRDAAGPAKAGTTNDGASDRVLFALHDNYIDFYPDAAGFSYEKVVAFHQNGTPVRAWNNEWRKAQSYRYRADAVEAFLQPNLKAIRADLAPDSYFVDVWSSIGPYDYWTADGRFVDRVYTRDSWGKHFAWMRELLGDDAPQISESGHDQLVGWLDGAQTNHLRVGKPLPGNHSWCVWDWRCADAERVPWLDVAHHDRFVLHGAGYPGRYEGGLDPRQHGIYSDDYISTEVLTGHPAMVSQAFSRDVVRKYWLLQGLARALAGQRIERVDFVDGDIHRQHVAWSGGGDVWVNRGEEDWKLPFGLSPHEDRAPGLVLPQYGFFAVVSTAKGLVAAGIVRSEGSIVELSCNTAAKEFYFNARQLGDGPLPAGATPREIERGAFRTAGAFLAMAQGNTLIFRPLPGAKTPKFSIRVNKTRSQSFAKLADRFRATAVTEDGKDLSRFPIELDKGVLTLDCAPGVFEYRLTPE
jgi:hypothetical protein